MVVAVGNVSLLEKGAEGRLQEEKLKLTLSTLSDPAMPPLLRLSETWYTAWTWLSSGRGEMKHHAYHYSTLTTALGGTLEPQAGLVGGEDPHGTACHLDTRCLQFAHT